MIYFSQKESYKESSSDHHLTLRTDQGMEITFWMESDKEGINCSTIILDDNTEFNATDDNLHAVFVMVFGRVHSLDFLKAEANIQFEQINSETAEDEANEAAMSDELSSPYMTGRV